MVNHSIDIDFHINLIVALVIVVAIILTLIWFFILNDKDRNDLKEIAIRGINNTFGAEENKTRTYIVSTATIISCKGGNQTICDVLASESVKKEIKPPAKTLPKGQSNI